MRKPRKIRIKQDTERCLGLLKLLFNMLDEQESALIGLNEYLEESPPDLYMYLDAKSTKIIAVHDEFVIVEYELDGELIVAEIAHNKIEMYSHIICELIQDELEKNRN